MVRRQARLRARRPIRRKRRIPAARRRGGALPRSTRGGVRLQAAAPYGLALRRPGRRARLSGELAHGNRSGFQRRALERRRSGIRARLRPEPERAPRTPGGDRVPLTRHGRRTRDEALHRAQ